MDNNLTPVRMFCLSMEEIGWTTYEELGDKGIKMYMT